MARVLAALFGVAALGLAGCGSGSKSQPLATGGVSRLTVPISIDEHLVSPKYTRLSLPGSYLIQIKNEGTAGHAVTIEHEGRTLETPTIAPGATYEVTLDLSDPGDYTLSYPDNGKDVTGLITMGSD
jgi:hypothetical protein